MKSSGWQRALDEFAARVRKAYNGGLDGLILYGSRARGTAHEHSDVDVLVVMNSLGNFWTELSRLQSLSGPIALEYDVVLSALPVDATDFADPTTPLLINAKREGKRVG